MNDRFQMRVVEIERMRRDAVDQRRACNVNALGTSKDGCLRSGLQHAHRSESCIRCFMFRRAHGAPYPVKQRAMRFFIHCIAPAARGMLRYEARQNGGDRWRVRVSGNLRVTRHR